MWKLISSKEIFTHPRLTLIEDILELPNGTRFDYLRWKDVGVSGVTVIAINKEGKILLQKEYSYPPNKKLFQFPGGKVPKEETLEDGANRELMEEANYYAHELINIGSFYPYNRQSANKMYVYVGKELEKKSLPADVMEEFESFWFTEEEIDVLIQNAEIENSFLLSAWMLYKAFLKR